MKRKERRQRRVLSYLMSQLKSGVKNTNEGKKPLSDKDKKRIEKEIGTLKARL